jgi:hypothetical protein
MLITCNATDATALFGFNLAPLTSNLTFRLDLKSHHLPRVFAELDPNQMNRLVY